MGSSTFDCDVFCDVIDNFGDAGISWRLACDLKAQKGWKVRLFINDLSTLSTIVPSVDPSLNSQEKHGIQIEQWKNAPSSEPSKVVIETFACKIPEKFEEKIAQSPLKPVWINFEYLSAEDWVEDFNYLPSPHPRLGYEKFYFYPGFTNKTAGVIIEDGIVEKQNKFDRKKKSEFLKSLNADPNALFSLFVFCYPSSPVELLAQALIKDKRPIQLLLAPGEGPQKLAKLLDNKASYITLVELPMVEQSSFDKLLWCADSLIVRGEDSFVRAQLSAIPFIWTIYPQENEVHIGKLLAFSEKYRQFQPNKEIGELWENVNLAWNKGLPEFIPLWAKWRNNLNPLCTWAERWREHLFSLQSLTINLSKFIEEKIKSYD